MRVLNSPMIDYSRILKRYFSLKSKGSLVWWRRCLGRCCSVDRSISRVRGPTKEILIKSKHFLVNLLLIPGIDRMQKVFNIKHTACFFVNACTSFINEMHALNQMHSWKAFVHLVEKPKQIGKLPNISSEKRLGLTINTNIFGSC